MAEQAWRTRLAEAPGLRVGVNWRGNPNQKRDPWRSMPPALFAGILDRPGLSVVSLQKDGRPEELAALAPRGLFLDAGPEFQDFADTAALVAALDLVISVDTAILHLAGALGTPAWGLLDFASDWQWLAGRHDSPWYPSVRLFRQARRGDWPSATAAAGAALDELGGRRAAG
jgi:hypothetical protein